MLKIETKKFKKALQVAALIARDKLPLQVLRGVLFDGDNITATNSEQSITFCLDWEGDRADLPKSLVETNALLSVLPKDTFTRVSVNGKMQIGKVALPLLDAGEFPVVPEVQYHEDQRIGFLPAKELQKMLEQTLRFVADPDEVRVMLRTISIRTKKADNEGYDGLEFAGTDGRRLSITSVMAEEIAENFEGYIPSESARILLGILKKTENSDIQIYYRPGENNERGTFFFTGKLWNYSCKARNGHFPNYNSALMESHKKGDLENSFRVNRAKLLAAVQEAIAVTPKKERCSNPAYALYLAPSSDGLLILFSGALTDGYLEREFETVIPCEILRGENYFTVINPDYLLDALETSDETDVMFSAHDPTSMIGIEDGTTREAYVMPVHVEFPCIKSCGNRVKMPGARCGECDGKEDEASGETSDSV